MALGWRTQYYRYKDFFLNVMSLYKKRADLRMFLEIILSLVTVTIFLIFALKPTVITIIGLIKEIGEKEKTVELLDTKIAALSQARNTFDENIDSISIIESSVPTQAEPDTFSAQMQGIASKNSVRLLGLSIGEITLVGASPQKKKVQADSKPLPGNAREMPVSISASGTYQNLNAFIKDMEASRRPIKVDSLSVNSLQTDTGQIISTIISGRIPFLGNE